MRKRTATMEWQIVEDDAVWARLDTSCMPTATPMRQFIKRLLWEIAAILLLLTSTGGWWRYTTQAQIHQSESELRTAVEREASLARRSNDTATLHWQYPFAQQDLDLFPTNVAAPGEQLNITLHAVEIHGDQAVATVMQSAQDGTPLYRQTRFYKHVATDWLQTLPDPTLWGPVRTLETASFLYHFRQKDTAVVTAIAPQIETLYNTLCHNFGLPRTPSTQKLIIEVSITLPPGISTAANADGPIHVPSPAAYQAPVALTDADLLAQSIALSLIEHLLLQVSNQYQIDAAWQPMISGLQLWQVWDIDLPLAAWREEIVRWFYRDLLATEPGKRVILPKHYRNLCAIHKLWMPAPIQLDIPLLCDEPAGEEWYLSPLPLRRLPTSLSRLVLPPPGDAYIAQHSLDSIYHPGRAIALATLIDYAVATYGREHLPLLLAGLSRYKTWDTLLPSVYGVSPTEFEAGWQAYLATRYGISTAPNR